MAQVDSIAPIFQYRRVFERLLFLLLLPTNLKFGAFSNWGSIGAEETGRQNQTLLTLFNG